MQPLARALLSLTPRPPRSRPPRQIRQYAIAAVIILEKTAPPKETSRALGVSGGGTKLRLCNLPDHEDLKPKILKMYNWMLDADKCPTAWRALLAVREQFAKAAKKEGAKKRKER